MKTVKVLYIQNKSPFSNDLWQNCLSQIPKDQQKKVNKFRFQKDKQASLLGKLLLKRVFNTFLTNTSLEDIQYTKYQKPYIDQDFTFNISHSRDYVVLAYSLNDMSLGIDIEEVNTKARLEDFYSILTLEERNKVNVSNNPHQSFYDIWTLKEAVCKADGRGLNLPLTDIQIREACAITQQNKWFYKAIDVAPSYKCHVTSNQVFEIVSTAVSIEELYEKSILNKELIID